MDIDWGALLRPYLKKESDSLKLRQESEYRAFADFSRLSEEDHVFEFGCRKGEFLFYIASKIKTGCGVDISTEDILEAKKNYSERAFRNLQFLSGQIGSLPLLADNFSIILSRFAIHKIYEYDKVFSELMKLSSPGGRLALKDQIMFGHETYDVFWNDFGRLLDVGHNQFASREFLVDRLHSMGLDIMEEIQLTRWVSLKELFFLNPRAMSRGSDIQNLLKKQIQSMRFSADFIKYEMDDLWFRIKYYLILGS
ncbi:MAG: methyltransferase domain-containing protein [Spirochaetales bacterium]|nr:methyltransferase domain-containing protein [Spirochaetales bacterium]